MKKLIIFDCDGVLVDSEIIANRVDAEILTHSGYPINLEDCIKRFTGLNKQAVRQLIRKETGVELAENFTSHIQEAMHAAFKKELQPLIFNLVQYIAQQNLPRCIASNSSIERIQHCLELTNQSSFFHREHIFTAQDVANGKPAPDVFLFAAQQMGYNINDCLIIEDSATGIKAAKAANIDVVAFIGGAHAQYEWYRKAIQEYNIPLAHNEDELKLLLQSYGLCSDH